MVALVAGLALSSCDKKYIGELLNMGYIQCTNLSSDTYSVSILGPTEKTFTMDGKSVEEISVKEGYYYVSVTQQSGYTTRPIERTFNGSVAEGQTMVVAFP